MIASLRGHVIDRPGNGVVVIEVAGVGYQVTMTAHGAARLPGSTEGGTSNEVFVWTHHHVREDAEVLFGFTTREDRDTFHILIGTHGVGPAMALSILGALGPEELTRAVLTDDNAALCRVPGVGKKTAARLLVELSSKLTLDVSTGSAATAGSTADGDTAVPAGPDGVLAEVHAALVGLGYGPDEISHAVKGLDPTLDSANALRTALRQLGGQRA